MNLEQTLQAAVTHHQANRLGEAEALYRQVLQSSPNHAGALFLLGYLARQMGQFDQAMALFQRSLTIQPKNIDCQSAMADLQLTRGRPDLAIEGYQRVVAMGGNRAETFNNLAAALEMTGQRDEAIATYKKALAIKPDWTEGHLNLAAALANADRYEEAVKAIDAVIKQQPKSIRAHTHLGNTRFRQGNLDDAHRAYAAAVAAGGNEPAPADVGNLADAYNNFGTMLDTRGQFDLGLKCFRKAIKLEPDFAEAHYNLSLALLRQGDFENGWKELEWRWKCDVFRGGRQYGKPQWTGEDISGKTILLAAEQGLGDAVQFIRFVPMVAERGAKIVVECAKPLVKLFQTVEGISDVRERKSELPPFDVYAPMMSLPAVFNVTLETIPAKVPYLNAPLDAIEKWHDRLASDTAKLRIGIAWAGHRGHMKDRWRSMPPEAFAPLAALPGVSLHSLMPEPLDPKNAAKLKIHDHAEHLTDLSETAALIEQMKLVISVDTVQAHLAGAMGKRVWNLLGVALDWRWMLNRADTPWYPKMRLFRQTKANEWTSVMQQVVQTLIQAGKK